ncbi:hypothetical protein pb186bvf_003085 [Paramecium bursaria]
MNIQHSKQHEQYYTILLQPYSYIPNILIIMNNWGGQFQWCKFISNIQTDQNTISFLDTYKVIPISEAQSPLFDFTKINYIKLQKLRFCFDENHQNKQQNYQIEHFSKLLKAEKIFNINFRVLYIAKSDQKSQSFTYNLQINNYTLSYEDYQYYILQ